MKMETKSKYMILQALCLELQLTGKVDVVITTDIKTCITLIEMTLPNLKGSVQHLECSPHESGAISFMYSDAHLDAAIQELGKKIAFWKHLNNTLRGNKND